MRVLWRFRAEIRIGSTFLYEIVLQDYSMNERGQHMVIIYRLCEVLDEEVGVSHVREALHLSRHMRTRIMSSEHEVRLATWKHCLGWRKG